MIEQQVLDIAKMHSRRYLDQNLLCPSNVHLYTTIDRETRHLILGITAEIAKKSVEVIEVEYPADWKQAFKVRWFPNWLLKKYPVKYTRRTFDASVLYPTMSVAGHKGYVLVTEMKGGNFHETY